MDCSQTQMWIDFLEEILAWGGFMFAFVFIIWLLFYKVPKDVL